jgi:electron transport complex protein RnfG
VNDPAGNRAVRKVFILVLFAVIASLAVGLLATATQEQIAENQARHARALVIDTLPGVIYDNEPALDVILLSDPDLPGSEAGLPAYRARLQGEIVATVMTVVAADGYVGPIKLLVGIDNQGRILRVRVSEHRETPGLGDKIEVDNSNWINIFNGATTANEAIWALKRDGGDFDQISGATVTSRSVIRAVHTALEWHTLNASRIQAAPVLSEP